MEKEIIKGGIWLRLNGLAGQVWRPEKSSDPWRLTFSAGPPGLVGKVRDFRTQREAFDYFESEARRLTD